jgi:hypothetical protein
VTSSPGCCTECGVAVEGVGIDVVPEPVGQVRALRMSRVGEHVEQAGVAVRAAAILRWTGPVAVQTVGTVGRRPADDADVVLPAVADGRSRNG